MTIQIRCNEQQKQVLQTKPSTANIIWFNGEIVEADAYVDLLFNSGENAFAAVTNKPVVINEVVLTLNQLPSNYSRINGWNTFLEKEKLELVTNNETQTAGVLQQLGYKHIVVPDIVGMIAARNIAMIINEAYFGLQDNISTKEQIDTAMKLGTNYPFGPFEWAEKIGIENIKNLLRQLSKTDERYVPCTLITDK